MSKIAILGPFYPFRGGIANFNYHLYKTLLKGNTVFPINYIKLYPKIIFPGKTQFDYENSSFRIDTKRWFNPLNPFNWKICAKKILELNPEILIVPYWSPIFGIQLGIILKNVRKKNPDIKIIAICHNVLPHERIPFQKNIFKFFTKYVDRIVVHSTSELEKLKKLDIKKDILKLFHPLYTGFKNENLDKEKCCKILEIPNKKNLLFFGHIRKYKGLITLLKTMTLLDNSFFLTIAGEFYENRKKYEEFIEEKDLQKRVKIFDKFIPDEDVHIFFNSSDVLILPYIECSQSGIVPLSYHFKKGVVASNVGGIKDVVIDGKSGILFKREDEEDLKLSIEKFFLKREEIEKFIEKFRENFSWENYFKKLIEF